MKGFKPKRTVIAREDKDDIQSSPPGPVKTYFDPAAFDWLDKEQGIPRNHPFIYLTNNRQIRISTMAMELFGVKLGLCYKAGDQMNNE